MGLFKGIDTVIIRVSNLDRSLSWYRDKLGLEVQFEDPGLRLAVLDTGGASSLTLWETIEPVSPASVFPILKTFDAQECRTQLRAAGVETGDLLEDPGVKYFTFCDPDGNKLEACQVVA